MSIVAIIPARGGSKSVPKKSIRPLGGYPLLAYSIAAARMTREIDRVILSTDSEEIAEVGRRYGAEIPFLRPAQFARDDSPDSEFVLHALDWMQHQENAIPDFFIHLRPTTPLREPAIMSLAIEALKGNPEATSLRSGHPASESPFKWFLRDEKGYFKSMREGLSNEAANLPRQTFPDVFIPDGYIDILRCRYVLDHRQLYGERMFGFVSPVCQEVDSPEDIEFLEFQIQQKRTSLLTYLQGYPNA